MVTLYVGPDRNAFHVHLRLLCAASPVFKAAFSGNFKESTERSMDLPEDDHEAINRLVQWLYSERYQLPRIGDESKNRKCFDALARLNTLGEKYQITGLKNNVIRKLFRMRRDFLFIPGPTLVAYVYGNTSQGSSFRKFLVDCYSWGVASVWFTKVGTQSLLADIPDFAADLAIALVQMVEDPTKGNPFDGDNSKYYEILESEDSGDKNDRSAKRARVA